MYATPLHPKIARLGLTDIGIISLNRGVGGPFCGAVDHKQVALPGGVLVYIEHAMLVLPPALGGSPPVGFGVWPSNSGAFGWSTSTVPRVQFAHRTLAAVNMQYASTGRTYSLEDYVKRRGNPQGSAHALRVAERTTTWAALSKAPNALLIGMAAKYYSAQNGTSLASHGYWQNFQGMSNSSFQSQAFAWAKPALSPGSAPLANARYWEDVSDVGLRAWVKRAPTGVMWLSGTVNGHAPQII